MLTMDVIELTLLLKSIGFRLDSIDYNEFRSWSKKLNDYGNSRSASATSTNAIRTADVDYHYINVEISCSKSKIVSNLSFKINDSEIAEVISSHAATTTDPMKFMACTCPKRESRSNSNSFWEVQRSGTFANQRRSANGLLNGETKIDHETSSNLLPTLSTKSIALTNLLTQVLLNQYKNNSPFGESIANNVDIKSIMLAVEKANSTSMIADADGKVNKWPSVSHGEDLNLITPLSSMNVTPNEQDVLLNFTIPRGTVNDNNNGGGGGGGDEFVGRNTMLSETVNTEAFSSPKSDLVTSSPCVQANERDAGIICQLKRARQSIDRALVLSMKLNVTRDLSQEMAVPAFTTTKYNPVDKNQNRSTGAQANRTTSTRITATSANGSSIMRAPTSTLNRRASLDSVGKMPSRSVGSPAIMSRLNVTRSNSTERPIVNAPSKLSLAHRAISGNGIRTNPTTLRSSREQPPTIKRSTSNLRRTSSPAVISNGTTAAANTQITRKNVASTKLTSLPSKVAKK